MSEPIVYGLFEKFIMRKDARFGEILNQIIKFSRGDFSGFIEISGKVDEIDAISAGLNALGDKLSADHATQNGFGGHENNQPHNIHPSHQREDQLDISKEENGNEDAQQFLTIFRNAPDAIVVMDQKGRVSRWNPAATRIFGWTYAEVHGKLLHEFLIPESYRKAHINGFERLLKTGIITVSSKKIQFPGLCKNGQEIQLEVTISPVQQDDQYYFIGFLRDCTDRVATDKEIIRLNAILEQRIKERTDELDESERKYRNLFENNPMPMWVIEVPSLRFLDVNESAIRKYQYTREEFLSMTTVDIRPDEEKMSYVNLERERPETQNKGIWKHFKKDGSLIYTEIIVHGITFEGKPARLILANDVTERKKAEDSLRLSERRFKKIFESKLIGFVVWDANRKILQANDLFLEMLGFTRDDLANGMIDWNDATPPEYRGADDLAMEQVNSNSTCEPFEKEYVRKDKTRLPVLIAVARIEDNLYVSFVLDISQRKKMADEILELNRNLEERVEARTAELKAVNKELESFSYSVSHDLRAPLRAIHGYSQMLVEDYQTILDGNGIRLLDNIKANAKKMGQLVDDLLTFSRMGKRQLNRSVADMNTVVNNVLNHSDFDLNGISIKVHSLETENVDPALMQVVFSNLIGNAIKYSSKKKQPRIEIGIKVIDGIKTYYVKDNGAGFDMTYYDKLFGVFQRLHSEREFEGTGVGLAIVDRIIRRHGGRVWADAEVNHGSTFYFSLDR